MEKILSPKLFQECPVWKWDETMEYRVPVSNWQPLPDDEPTLFIKADFIAADGTEFEGYLVGLETYYAFGIFVGDTAHAMNLNLPDMIETSLQDICQELGVSGLKLFPLAYKSELYFEGEPPLIGTITP